MSGFVSISQIMAMTAKKAGKPQANQMRYRLNHRGGRGEPAAAEALAISRSFICIQTTGSQKRPTKT